MSSLDMRTIMLLSFIDGFLLGVIFLYFSRIKTKYAGTYELGLSLVITSISMILFSMQNIAGPFISIVLANTVCVAGLALIPCGLRKFLGLAVNPKYYAALICTFFLIICYNTFITPEYIKFRILTICAVYFIIFYYSFHILFFLNKLNVLKTISRMASVIYLLVALFSLYRLIVFTFFPGVLSFNMMSSQPGLEKNMYLLTLLLGNVYIISSYTLFILMLNLRLEGELIESEDKLKEHVRELEKSDASKNTFISIISHDLKNPVEGMSSLLKMMKPEPQNFQKFANEIELLKNTSNGVSALLNNLLEWARAQTKNIECKPEIISLKEAALEAMKIFELRAVQKKINMLENIGGQAMIRADRKMISTILRNLISNAIKFSKENGKIVISASLQNGMASLTVSDNGVGMKSETADTIFKLDRPNYYSCGTAGEKGTGLGLLICKEFAELNRGTIKIKSSPGEGTEVTLVLPAHSPQ